MWPLVLLLLLLLLLLPLLLLLLQLGCHAPVGCTGGCRNRAS
jgi:hypothetical protein